jgi:hypothetical protein
MNNVGALEDKGGKGERQTRTRACRDQSPTFIAMAGNATAEAFITRQWLPVHGELIESRFAQPQTNSQRAGKRAKATRNIVT